MLGRLAEICTDHPGIPRRVKAGGADPLVEWFEEAYSYQDLDRSAFIADRDDDGLPDLFDNCIADANPDQLDYDEDGRGDACDLDADRDRVEDRSETGERLDNCPYRFNPGDEDFDGNGHIDPEEIYVQRNADGDGLGDVCDPDDDDDGILDCGADARCRLDDDDVDNDLDGRTDEAGECSEDECARFGLDSFDNYGDGHIDEANEGLERFFEPYPGPDPDGSEGNCRLAPNPDQRDTDRDGLGDACDPDDDNDEIPDDRDLCPLTADPEQLDLDGDGLGGVVDADRDGDGVDNAAEEAQGSDPDRADTDSDQIGDADDICPTVADPDQLDADQDGRGDACDDFDDRDDDRDGVANSADECPESVPSDRVDAR